VEVQSVPQHATTKIKFLLIGFICFQVLIENSYFLFPVENALQLHANITGLELIIFVSFIGIFLLLSYKDILLKLMCLFWISVQFFSVMIRFIVNYFLITEQYEQAIFINDAFNFFWIWIYLIIPMIYLLWRSKHFFHQLSDQYDKNGTFLLFKKPDDLLGLLLTFSFKPTSSISVFHKDVHYCYKRDVDGFHKRPATKTEINRGRLIRIIPPKNFTAFLESKVGTEYKLIRHNCITVLKGSGIHIGPFDFIPSIFSSRFAHDT